MTEQRTQSERHFAGAQTARPVGLTRPRVARTGVLHRQTILAEGIRSLLQRTGEHQVFIIPTQVREAHRLHGLDLQLLVVELTAENVQLARDLAGSVPAVFVFHQNLSLDLVMELLELPLAALADLSRKDDIQRACNALLLGDSYLSPNSGLHLLRGVVGLGRNVRLTSREQTIMQALRERRDLSQIAQGLHLSPSTVKNHLSRIYQKLNVKNRRQALEHTRSLEFHCDTGVGKE